MLANEAIDLIKLNVWNDYKVGKKNTEYMTSVAGELVTLETEGFVVSMNVTGACFFKYGNEEFEKEKDLVGRPDILKAMRNDTIEYEEIPWFDVQYNDSNGDLIASDIIEIAQLPTTLEIKAILIRELKNFMDLFGENMSTQQIDLLALLPRFNSVTVKLNNGVRANSIQHKMTDFLVKNEELLQVLGAIEMDSRKDEYNEKWFTFFCYCSNDDAMQEIREEVLKYGKIW